MAGNRKRSERTYRCGAGFAVLALVLAACSSGDRDASDSNEADSEDGGAEVDDGDAAAEPVELEQAEPSPREDVPSALDDMTNDEFPEPLLDTSEIVSGGPPPDGIPAIDEPKFERVEDVD